MKREVSIIYYNKRMGQGVCVCGVCVSGCHGEVGARETKKRYEDLI
jgi:hypothetical protein